jgi:hypothetical protein
MSFVSQPPLPGLPLAVSQFWLDRAAGVPLGYRWVVKDREILLQATDPAEIEDAPMDAWVGLPDRESLQLFEHCREA